MQYRYPLCWEIRTSASTDARPAIPVQYWEPVEVEITEVPSKDAPVVLETPEMQVRWFRKAHWYPFTVDKTRRMPDRTGDTHADILQQVSLSGDYEKVLTFVKNPLVSMGMWSGRIIPPTRFVEGKSPECRGRAKDEAMAAMNKSLAETILIDGYLWTKGGPPVLAACRDMPLQRRRSAVTIDIENIDRVLNDTNQRFYRREWIMFSPQTTADRVVAEIEMQWPDLRREDIKLPDITVRNPETLRDDIHLIELRSQVGAAIGDWWASSVLSQKPPEGSEETPDWHQIDGQSISLFLRLREALERVENLPTQENLTALAMDADAFVRESKPQGSDATEYLSRTMDRWLCGDGMRVDFAKCGRLGGC